MYGKQSKSIFEAKRCMANWANKNEEMEFSGYIE
jgi:hypothetical protein